MKASEKVVYVSCRFTPLNLTYAEQHEISLILRNDILESITGRKGWHFAVKYNGKPYVEGENITYSVSHTNGCVACAVSVPEHSQIKTRGLPDVVTDEKIYLASYFNKHGEIGCDVENCRGRLDAENIKKIAGRYFTESEKEEFENSCQSIEAFYRLWTVKESLVKATGEGLGALRRTDKIKIRDVLSFKAVHGEEKFSAAISVVYE